MENNRNKASDNWRDEEETPENSGDEAAYVGDLPGNLQKIISP